MQELEPTRWDNVRVFLAAYRLLSLGMAASRMGVDTSTISRRIAALERQLGVQLFERSRDGLRRTAAAEQIFEAAEAMETAHARMARDATGAEARAEGTVRLTLDPGTAEFFVVPALCRLRAEHPHIEIEIDASPLPRDLLRREADLALRSSEIVGADLVTTRVSVQAWVAVGSHALIEAIGPLATWDAAPWIVWDRDMSNYPPSQWLARNAPRAATPLRTSHFASQVAAAEAGLGLALLPAPYANRPNLDLARTTSALAGATEPWPHSELWLVAPRVLRSVPRVAVVWEFLAEEMRRLGRMARAGA